MTGRFVEPDRLLEAGPRRLSAALSTSAAGLVEERVTASPWGVRVNLRGRFRSAIVARHGLDGALATECGHGGDGRFDADPPQPQSAAEAPSRGDDR